jgi:hypothetical protein
MRRDQGVPGVSSPDLTFYRDWELGEDVWALRKRAEIADRDTRKG